MANNGAIFLVLFGFVSVGLAVDPCYDFNHTTYGIIGSCMPRTACQSGVSMPDIMCPSSPPDSVCCFDEKMPGREHRGAWVATVANIDWPFVPADSVGKEIADLKNLVDTLHFSGFNAIYFQVRPHGDALYASNIEPWSQYLTGAQGVAPSPMWDPLQFVIEYAHARDIEVHAWINPYRANMRASTEGLAPNHMAIQYPQFAYTYGTYLWMDPGAEVVQNRTFEVVVDIVTRYDVDGLHMDDYFYPYPVVGETFPDDATYREYVEGGGEMAKDDWRRDNVNKLVERLNTGIHSVKPWVKFSISPFGIYRAGHPEGMPPPIVGFDQYSEIYCDPKLWMHRGWVDILIPQLYWRIAPPAQSYPVLLDWWAQENIQNRHVYGGNYLSRVLPSLQDWPMSEISAQIDISRETRHRSRGSWGNVQFSAQILRDDIKGAVVYFRSNVYRYPALQPPFPWLSEGRPLPKPLEVSVNPSGLSWDNSDPNLHKVVIYEKAEVSWHVWKILQKSENQINMAEHKTLAVAAVDRFGREGEKRYVNLN